MEQFIKGMDISTLCDLEGLGAVYYMDGKPQDMISILSKCGVNYIRLRLWHSPYSEDGVAYGGGNNDLFTVVKLARRAKQYGMGVLLSIHYSDFWADSIRQTKPKAWLELDANQLELAVYEYTKQVMVNLHKEGVAPTMVQIGNGINQGLLWPEGKVPNYSNITRFIRAGIQAVRSIDSAIPIVLHMDQYAKQQEIYTWYDHYKKEGDPFDLIGLSYIPIWQDELNKFIAQAQEISEYMDKPLLLTETAYPYTTQEYDMSVSGLQDNPRGMIADKWRCAGLEYETSEEGQFLFLSSLIRSIKALPNKIGVGVFYFEPGWLPIKEYGCATEESLDYIGGEGSYYNEFANMCLFNYLGHTNKALLELKKM